MSEIFFRFCDFIQDLTELVLEEQPLHSTLFVFPTRANQARTVKQAQQRWAFETTDFITMEDMKEMLFFCPAPLLKEEKRRIAFFVSLKPEHRQALKISNYFQSLQTAREFFTLWEEFNEELVKDPIDTEKLNAFDAQLLDWQLKTFDHFTDIRTNYRSFVHSRGFTDRIFTYKPENIRLKGLTPFRRIVFVNQFYYTRLEKRLIDELSARFEIYIYFQLPEKFVDKQDLSVKSFDLPGLKPYNTKKLHIYTAANDFAMITALFGCLNNNKIETIIDDSFIQKPYSAFFSRSRFNLPTSKNFRHTSVFRFFNTAADLLSGIIWESDRENVLLPLQLLRDAVVCTEFFNYFTPDSGQAGLRQKTLDYFENLAEENFKYIFLEKKSGIPDRDKDVTAMLERILLFCRQMGRIKTIQDFIRFIDAADGVVIKKIVTQDELQHSDILDIFYRLLSDFGSLENPVLVANWENFFSTGHYRIKNYLLAGSLVKLFLEYIQKSSIRLLYKKQEPIRLDLSDLQDTRNIYYNSVAVLNVIEGQIPHARRIQFLFSEKQRRLLGLKTWEDVRLWEKYYFYRLVLSTPQVFLFTQQNTEQNIDVSSFIEEIRLSLPKTTMQEISIPDRDYQLIYSRFLQYRNVKPDKNQLSRQEFYALKPDMETIWQNRCVDLIYYAWKDLQNNHFEYYLKHQAGLKEHTDQIKEEFSG
ncbi:hypothetical protein JW935_17890, partial [candidate division KSB1 bacterium]|nr:hypothetical protein [candidate division KSB1 bacterium]